MNATTKHSVSLNIENRRQVLRCTCGMSTDELAAGGVPRPSWIAAHAERVAADLGTTAAELLAR